MGAPQSRHAKPLRGLHPEQTVARDHLGEFVKAAGEGVGDGQHRDRTLVRVECIEHAVDHRRADERSRGVVNQDAVAANGGKPVGH